MEWILVPGTHQLPLTKERYAPGNTPVDLSAEELPGGGITVELGGLSRDRRIARGISSARRRPLYVDDGSGSADRRQRADLSATKSRK